MKKKFIWTILVLLLCPSAASAQTPDNLRVLTDAANSLLVAGSPQVSPVSQPTQFINARLKTDANGNLLVVLTGGTISGAITIPVSGNGTTPTDALTLINQTLSNSVTTIQAPPCIDLTGHVWNGTTAADNTNQWFICSLPSDGATPSGLLKFGSSLNGGAATYPLTVTNAGALTAAGGITAGLSVGIGATSAVIWSARSQIYAPADGQFILGNNGLTAGIGFDVTTDSTLKGRVRAQNAYGLTDWGGYLLSGVLAVSGTAPTIASGGCTTGSAQTLTPSNGTFAFAVTLGGATCGNTITLTMPTASNDWSSCMVNDITAAAGHVATNVRIISSTQTSLVAENQTTSTGAAVAMVAAHSLQFLCGAK